VECEATGLS